MYDDYDVKGLRILAFPCNQFRDQEPGSPEEINEFIRTKYGGKFWISEKIDVNGINAHPAFVYLRQKSSLYDAAKK